MTSKNALVVVAHPDDEVLGCGGMIAKLSKQGTKVNILFISELDLSRRFSLFIKTLPPIVFPGNETILIIDCAVTDLPEPDSPTNPTISPRPISKDTSSTALTVPRRRKK